MDNILTYLGVSFLFYFGSLVERQFTKIDFDNKENPVTFKKIIIGYLIFLAATFWVWILFNANQSIINE